MSPARKKGTVPVRYYAMVDRGKRAHIVNLRTRTGVCGVELPPKGMQVAISDSNLWVLLRVPVCASCDRMKDSDSMHTIVGRAQR